MEMHLKPTLTHKKNRIDNDILVKTVKKKKKNCQKLLRFEDLKILKIEASWYISYFEKQEKPTKVKILLHIFVIFPYLYRKDCSTQQAFASLIEKSKTSVDEKSCGRAKAFGTIISWHAYVLNIDAKKSFTMIWITNTKWQESPQFLFPGVNAHNIYI